MKISTIQDILSEAGYDVSGISNRQRNVRSINNVLSNSEIKIEIAKNGYHKVDSKGNKFTVKLSLAKDAETNHVTRFNISSPSDTYQLLKCIAAFLKREDVHKKISAQVQTPHTCVKCNGSGFIPQFAWYAEGVCFDCLGVGTTGILSVKIENPKAKKTGMKFCNQFYNSRLYKSEFFENNVKIIKPIQFKDSETAVTYLGEHVEGGYYYIYQPICKANSYYAIPAEQMDEFTKQWNACHTPETQI